MKQFDRRSFIKDAGFFTLVASAAGCQFTRMGFGDGAPMAGFAAPKLDRVRVAFVGVGGRGIGAVKRLTLIPGVDIAAICDIDETRIKKSQEILAAAKLPPAREFLGPEAYKDLCQWDGCDVVYASVPWKLHAPVALAAMRGGKHALVEVPATMWVDDCWDLVETSEKTRRHCMMLENCCYGEHELLMLNMCRLGLLGEPVLGGAGYIHSSEGFSIKHGPSWRNEWYREHKGNFYPTHGLGPVAQYMNINRGDAFDYLVSVETDSIGPHLYGVANYPKDSWQATVKLETGDYNTSLIRTKNGRAIYLSVSCHSPHPYSRINMIQGTKGVAMDWPLRIRMIEQWDDDQFYKPFDEKRTEAYRQKYMHPLWKQIGEYATKVGGHGGMDFVMDLRWVYCLRNGLPLDMDVYDLASWSCLCEVTEKSVRNRSKAVDIPDFTRGAWKTMKPLGIETVDLAKVGNLSIGASSHQLDVNTIGR